MKFDASETAPSGRTAIKLRVGIDEVGIIRGLLQSALAHTPKTKSTEKTIERMRAMSRCLWSPEVKEWIEKGYTRHGIQKEQETTSPA